MAQQRFSTAGKVSPEKLMSSPVFESIQSSNLPLEAPSEILYANVFSGEEPVEMPADLKEVFNDPHITLTAPNFRAQLEQLMNQYDSDAGPWYIDGSDGILLIHNKKVTDQTETLYRYQDETGEVLKVQVTTNYVSAGVGQSMVSLGATSKGLYGTTNIAPTLEDTLNEYGDPTDESPTKGLNIVGTRPEGTSQFATSLQFKNRYPAIREPDRPVVRTMDGTSQRTLLQNEYAANANAVRQYSSNDLFLQKVMDAIQQLVNQNINGVQVPLFKAQLLDYIKTGNVGSVLGLILNKEIPLADKTITRFTHRSRLHYTKTFPIKHGKHRDTPTDQILEEIKNSLKASASSSVGKSRDRGVAEWKINGTWYTDAEITAMARRSTVPGSAGRNGYVGAAAGRPVGINGLSQMYIQQTANEASARYFITDATIQGAQVINYGDKIVVKIDLSGRAPVKVTVKDMINMMAQREGSPVAMIKQANALRNSNKKAKRKEIEVQMVVVGNPLLEAGQTLAVQNIGKKYSGYWHIKTCIHKLDSNGFTTSLTLDRGSGSSGVTVSASVTGQVTTNKTSSTHSGKTKAVVTPNRTDNWNSGDIALLQGMGAAAQSGDKNAEKVYNEMVELMRYASTQSTTGEPLYEVDTSEFVYNYPTEHRRPGKAGTPKVKMTPAGKKAYEAMVKARAEEAKRQAAAAKQALKNLTKPNTAIKPPFSLPK